MFEKFLRIIGWTESSASFGEYLLRVFGWLTALGAGGMTAWAASATEWLNQYGPIAWVIAGVMGTFTVLLAFQFWISLKRKMLFIKVNQKILDNKSNINPMDMQFYNKKIDIRDFIPPAGGIVQGKTFQNCQIIGPLNIYPYQCDIRKCTYVSVDHIVIDPNKIRQIMNAQIFEQCIFINCQFFFVSFLINSTVYEAFSRMGGCNWITHTIHTPEQHSLDIDKDDDPKDLIAIDDKT